MKYAELLAFAILPLAFIYYVLVVLQLVGVVKFTKSKIKFPLALIPFFYYFK